MVAPTCTQHQGVIGRAAFGSEWHRILVPNGPHQATAPEPSGTEPLAFELRRGLSANPAERHASISEWIEAVSDAAIDHAAVTQTAYEGGNTSTTGHAALRGRSHRAGDGDGARHRDHSMTAPK